MLCFQEHCQTIKIIGLKLTMFTLETALPKQFLKIIYYLFKLARACGVPVGGRLATTLGATKNDIIFFLFFSFFLSSTFLIEGALGSKNVFRES